MLNKTIIFLFVIVSILAFATVSFAEGRKMGLFVGINEYQDGINPLKSCVNDAVKMQEKLSRNYGFNASNMTLLTDAQATRQNILNKLEYYEKETTEGDMFVFYYSGHGAVFPDALSPTQDETEQFGMKDIIPTGYYDSTLVPVDARRTTSGKTWKNMILDDELNTIFSRFTAKGVQVIFISDSCHSGTLAKSLNLDNSDELKFVTPKSMGFNVDQWQKTVLSKGRKSSETYNKLFLVMGSSQDNQFSLAKNPETGTKMSLFTYALLKHLEFYESKNRSLTYRSINGEISQYVNKHSDGTQTPRLDARFFDSALLDVPMFSLQSNSIAKMRIVVKVTDDKGNPLADASFGVFPTDATIGKGQILESDVLMLGKTNKKGLFDSSSQRLSLGIYKIKVVKDGYQAFIRDMKVIEGKNNTLVFVFELVQD